MRLGNARTAVGDRDREESSASAIAAHAVGPVNARRDGDGAPAVEGLRRVLHEVQERLVELRGIADDRRQARIEFGHDRDRTPTGRLLLQVEHVTEDAMDVERLQGRPLRGPLIFGCERVEGLARSKKMMAELTSIR